MSEQQYTFNLIDYDGINLFKDGEWTKIEFDSVDAGRNMIGFLETLTNEQADHWIRTQQYLKGANQTFNNLKYGAGYSGQTTDHGPRANDAWKATPNTGKDCIQAVNFFDVQWSNCPVEVEDEVRKLWQDRALGNDNCFVEWDDLDDDDYTGPTIAAEYPIIANYLKSRGIVKCYIHWWW